jgi:hypothetical protein
MDTDIYTPFPLRSPPSLTFLTALFRFLCSPMSSQTTCLTFTTLFSTLTFPSSIMLLRVGAGWWMDLRRKPAERQLSLLKNCKKWSFSIHVALHTTQLAFIAFVNSNEVMLKSWYHLKRSLDRIFCLDYIPLTMDNLILVTFNVTCSVLSNESVLNWNYRYWALRHVAFVSGVLAHSGTKR